MTVILWVLAAALLLLMAWTWLSRRRDLRLIQRNVRDIGQILDDAKQEQQANKRQQ